MRLFTLTLVLLVCCIAGCETTRPEQSPQAEAGYRSAAPIIAAIDRFYKDHGRYPAKLAELLPKYLGHVHQIQSSHSWEDQTEAFQYYPKRDRYALTFAYFTSSVSVMCSYSSQTRK